METRTVHDPFVGEDVQISNRLVDRLRGKYASGPHLPNGLPEFGWRQFQATPINLEAAERIEALEAALRDLAGDEFWLMRMSSMHDVGAMEDVIRDFAKAAIG